jgi:hypothetical protein
MSIDLEDFEFAVATRFPQAFPRGQSVTLTTPRALIEHLTANGASASDMRSIKQHAFYRIRALLVRELGCGPGLVRPATRLDVLLPNPAERRRQWARIRAALGAASVPRLSRPTWLVWTITVFVGLSFLGAASFVAAHFSETALIIPSAGVVAGVLLFLVVRVTQSRAVHLPLVPATVGELASMVTAYGSPLLDPALQPGTRAQVLEVVRELIRFELGAALAKQDVSWKELAKSARSAA